MTDYAGTPTPPDQVSKLLTWPNWPNPPIVEMSAIRARMENGDWLILADGVRPVALLPLALPR